MLSNVVLPAPKILRQTSVGTTAVHVKWEPVPFDGFEGILAGYQFVYNEDQKPNEKKIINNILVNILLRKYIIVVFL